MSLAIYPSVVAEAAQGPEVPTSADVTEERIEAVLNVMKVARTAVELLFGELGIAPGEIVMVGKYEVMGRRFCAIPIRNTEAS